MQTKLKHIACVVALGAFISMGSISDLMDESTNYSINLKPSDCEEQPPFTGKVKVTFTNHFDAEGKPSTVDVFFNNQKIINNEDCTSFYQHSFVLTKTIGVGDTETFESPSFTHDNKGDLWRIQTRSKVVGAGTYQFDKTEVLFYNQTQLSYTLGTLPKL